MTTSRITRTIAASLLTLTTVGGGAIAIAAPASATRRTRPVPAATLNDIRSGVQTVDYQSPVTPVSISPTPTAPTAACESTGMPASLRWPRVMAPGDRKFGPDNVAMEILGRADTRAGCWSSHRR